MKESFFCLHIVPFGFKDYYLSMMGLREVIVCNTDLWQFFFQSGKVWKGWKMEVGRHLSLISCGISIDSWSIREGALGGWKMEQVLYSTCKHELTLFRLGMGLGALRLSVKDASSRRCFSCPDTSQSGKVACKYPWWSWFLGRTGKAREDLLWGHA